MAFLQTTNGFVAFLVIQLAAIGVGWSSIGADAEKAKKEGLENRSFESLIQTKAIDAGSVREREKVKLRLLRALKGLDALFGYRMDPDGPAVNAGDDANAFSAAVRKVRDDLQSGTGSQLRFPPDLGFPAAQPKDQEELETRLLQLDALHHMLRCAREAKVDGFVWVKPAVKGNLIDGTNFLQFARVELLARGTAQALYQFAHQLQRPGKYLAIEEASFSRASPESRGKVKPEDAGFNFLRLVVSAQLITPEAEGTLLEAPKKKKAGGPRPVFNIRKRG